MAIWLHFPKRGRIHFATVCHSSLHCEGKIGSYARGGLKSPICTSYRPVRHACRAGQIRVFIVSLRDNLDVDWSTEVGLAFDGQAFVRQVAKRLIQEFEFSTSAGTPGLVGAAKEHPARVQLQALMPDGIGVGSGIVVDSYGGVSKQQDIVIFEKLSPVFSHNGTPEATFYPVEGVIAVGEVKSTLNKNELRDACEKSASVKALRRHAVATDVGVGPAVSYRQYGERLSFAAVQAEQFDQDKNTLHQVFTFVLCHKFGPSPQTTLQNATELFRNIGIPLAPNFIASLSDGFIVPYKSAANSITRAPMEADDLMFCDQSGDAFARLLSMVRIYTNSGKTVDARHYDRYYASGCSDLRIVSRARL